MILMKIAILGFSGCGKSTLARMLGEKYNCPVLHMDSLNFKENWVGQDREIMLSQVITFLDRNDTWIIDGNYTSMEQERRLNEADQIILLELNRFVCLFRVLKRWKMYYGTTRPDMAEGCNEKVDWEFVHWVLHDGRTKKKKASYANIAATYPQKVTRIKTVREQKKFLKSLEV